MATRFDQPVTRRSPLPLTERDEADLAKLRSAGPARAALARLTPSTPLEGVLTEAALLHAVFRAGMRVVHECAEEAGYAQLAAEYEAEDEERRKIARRRAVWTDEA
jgi:hypothetical protein